MDEDELDQELALPSLLSNISMTEKKKLLEFKKTHTEVRPFFYAKLFSYINL